MSPFAKITMVFVVFVDLLGQGLVFPILNSLIMEPGTSILPQTTSMAMRHFNYGLIIGIFFLCWFFGAPYISKLSDQIGRKNAILICLFGALAGYALTIAALYVNSFLLLILGRAITGLTAGNQPIAQAAMVDGSTGEEDLSRNMGFIMVGISLGLVGGPLIGGFLSDPVLIGAFASIKLPFYACLALVACAVILVVFFYHEAPGAREAFALRPAAIFETLWRIREFPLVLRLAIVLFFFHLANVTFYVFVANYLSSRFDYGTLGTSFAMMTIGAAIAISSTFLVVPLQKRFNKERIIAATFGVWIVATAAFILSPDGPLTYVPVFCFYLMFGATYPILLGIFSAAVGEEEQGWVMGITVAVFTFVAGVMSLVGGELMGINLDLPFYIVIAAALVAMLAMFLVWNKPEIKSLMRAPRS